MSQPDQHSPPDHVANGDPLQTIEGLKHTGLRVGCFGCTLSGWSVLLAAAGLVALIYFFWR